jgi:hypothetical protein
MVKGHVIGMVSSPWAGAWICLAKYWHPLLEKKRTRNSRQVGETFLKESENGDHIFL